MRLRLFEVDEGARLVVEFAAMVKALRMDAEQAERSRNDSQREVSPRALDWPSVLPRACRTVEPQCSVIFLQLRGHN